MVMAMVEALLLVVLSTVVMAMMRRDGCTHSTNPTGTTGTDGNYTIALSARVRCEPLFTCSCKLLSHSQTHCPQALTLHTHYTAHGSHATWTRTHSAPRGLPPQHLLGATWFDSIRFRVHYGSRSVGTPHFYMQGREPAFNVNRVILWPGRPMLLRAGRGGQEGRLVELSRTPDRAGRGQWCGAG